MSNVLIKLDAIPVAMNERLLQSDDAKELLGEELCAELSVNDEVLASEMIFHDNAYALAVVSSCAQRYRAGEDYSAIRNEFVAASMAANCFGLSAPVFRDFPKLSGVLSERKKQTQILVDQIVIDCHWLYVRGEDAAPKWPELQKIFDKSSPFDVEEVCERIASKKWSANFKVEEAFILTERQQFQLVQMRSNAVKDKMRRLLEGRLVSVGKGSDGKERGHHVQSQFPYVRRKIREWAEHRPRVTPSIQMHESLWLARELLGPKSPLKHIAELAAYRCGCTPLSPKTVDEKLKALDRRLAEFP